MEQHETAGSAGAHDRPLGRGLQEVSHLFVSAREGPARDRTAVSSPEHASPAPRAREAVALLRPMPVTRDRLAAILMQGEGMLEDGLRAIDARIHCHPCGEIDLLAVDRASRLTIIDFETTFSDGLLLRGVGHFDWIVRNMPNVQRMYQGQAIDFSLPPRLILLAPRFSPLLRNVARQITRPQIHWIRYHTVLAPAGPGILFEPVEGE